MLLSCDKSAWNQYIICDIWYITSTFGLINEETKLKYKTAHFIKAFNSQFSQTHGIPFVLTLYSLFAGLCF